MSVSSSVRGVLGVLLLLGGFACNNEPSTVPLDEVEAAVTEVLCDRVFTCNCVRQRHYYSAFDCEQDAARLAQELRDLPGEHPGASLTYDPACVGAMVDGYAEMGCGPEGPEAAGCERPCHFYYGNGGEGDHCQIYEGMLSSCGQGLVCAQSRCTDPCGGTCDGPCAADEFCDPWSRSCERIREEGQICANLQCAEGLECKLVFWANPTGAWVCVDPKSLGASCMGHAECESDYCPAGFCDAPPGVDEACPAEVCAEGLDCVSGTCVPAVGALCTVALPSPGDG